MSTTEEQLEQIVIDDAWSHQTAAGIDELRQRAQTLADTQRERVHRAQASLDELRRHIQAEIGSQDQLIDQKSRELDDRNTRVEEREKKLHDQREDVAEQSKMLQQLKEEQTKQQDQWEQLRQRYATQQDDLFSQLNQRLQGDSQQATDRQDSNGQQLKLELWEFELQKLESELQEATKKREASEAELSKRERLLEEQQGRQQMEDGESPDFEDMRSQLELALGEVHDLKSANESVQKKLQSVHGGGTYPVIDSSSDWETQKREMLAHLESSCDETDEEQVADRQTADDIIRKTDQLLTGKQREIDELKQLLEEQSSNIGDVAVGAAAIAGILEDDELIMQERETLSAMQDEWRQKLRIAEVDISMERAKLARDRADLEEKIQELERQLEQSGSGENTKENSSKANRGRWLERLGLKSDD
jgi:hypothetical protein